MFRSRLPTSRFLFATLLPLMAFLGLSTTVRADHISWEDIQEWFGYEDDSGSQYVCHLPPDEWNDGEYVTMNDVCVYLDHGEYGSGYGGDDVYGDSPHHECDIDPLTPPPVERVPEPTTLLILGGGLGLLAAARMRHRPRPSGQDTSI